MRSASCRGSGRLLFLLVALSLAACDRGNPPPAAQPPARPTAAELAEQDRGVGLMGRFDFAAAREIFAGLAKRHPDWYEARLDLAIATLNRQQDGDEAAARDQIRALAKERPDDLHVLYLQGLIALHGESPAAAEPSLRRVVDGDPQDAYAAYFLAQSLLGQGRAADALPLFRRALELDPRLRSARYGAAQALSRLSRNAEAAGELDEFQRDRNNPLARLAEFKYTRMGAKSEAVGAPRTEATRPASVGPPLGNPTVLVSSRGAPRSNPVASVADIDGDGRVDLYVPGGRGAKGDVLLRRNGRFESQPGHPLAAIAGVEFAAWGDIDNDGLTDVLLCRAGAPPLLLRQRPKGTWTPLDIPALRNLSDARDCMLYDADHDGDLDIFIVTERGARMLIANNGNGTFRMLNDRLPPPPKSGGAVQVLAADLDNDRDLDLVVLHRQAPHEVVANERLWKWSPAQGFEAFAREPALAVVAGDLDGRGETQLLTLTPALALIRWSRQKDNRWTAQMLVPGTGSPAAGVRSQLALADLDGDGRPEIIVTTERGIAVYRIAGDRAERLLDIPDPTVIGFTIATLDDQGPSLITHHLDGRVALRTSAAGRAAFALLELRGRDDPAQSIRSNASGIGARVAARVGGRDVVVDTLRQTSGPGQSLQPVAIALNRAPRIDYASIDWSDGVLQTELGLDASRVHRIVETQRQLSSCPLVFVFDGKRYAFVSDILGVGGLGYLVAPGEYASPRPRENFLLPDGLLAPDGDRYGVKIAEPMEEIAYIDAIRLVAHDLPPGFEMALDERMQIAGAPPTGAPLYFRRQARLLQAVNDRGEDVTSRVRTADHVAADPGPHDPRYIGRLAHEHVLTLTFDADLDAGPGRAVLIADGWIEYPYSQTMFAAWQAHAPYQAPTLEAKGKDGQWQIVQKEFGYPAGMLRTMAFPLPRLPKGTRTLRLRTNQEIYWDRLAIVFAERAGAVTYSLPLVAASVQPIGFPLRTSGPGEPPSYDYGRRVPLWDTRVPAGTYTAYGRVDPLVAATDDAVAILGPGDELHVQFASALSPLPAGWSRRFVLETNGWAKDMDLYTREGETVGPLPTSGRDAVPRDRLNTSYNTRFASGR